MTMISSAAGQPASQTSPAGFAGLLANWANGLAAYWMRREAIKALSDMDDRGLRDIGLVRSQIDAAVGGALNPGMAKLR